MRQALSQYTFSEFANVSVVGFGVVGVGSFQNVSTSLFFFNK